MFSLPLLLWAFAVLLAIVSLLKLCALRREQLESQLRRWLAGELQVVNKKRKLFQKVRKQRADHREAEVAATRRAAAAAAEIADLNIREMFADRERRDAETAAAAKKMRIGA